MTPAHDPAHDPARPQEPDALSADPQDTPLAVGDEEDAEVAALLAGTLGRTPAAAPPDVVARLDDVLAGLVAERRTARPTPEGGGATVVPLASRRRRLLPRALLAAAAVVVGGYAVGNLALGGSLGGSLGGADEGSAGGAGGAVSAGDSASRADGAESLDGERPREDGILLVPPVRRNHLAADVRRVVARFGTSGAPGALLGEGEGEGEGEAGTVDGAADCPVPRLTDAQRLYLVRYQKAPAGLVVGPRREGRVDVTVYSCRDGGVRLSRTVPAP